MRNRSLARRVAPFASVALAAPVVLAAQSRDSTRVDTVFLAPTVVTVLRNSVELARAPYAVSAVTRDQLDRGQPGLALDETLAGVPGVQVDNRFNYALGERISIRGFGARAQFGVRGVRVLLDGVPMTLADGQTSLNNVDVGSITRAEVVRGPASALHGNAAGGVIQLTTQRPAETTTRALGGEAGTEFGDHQLRRAEAAIAGRSSDVSYRAGGSRVSYGGYRDWNTARNDHATARVALDAGDRVVALTANWVDYDARNPGALSAALVSADRRQAFTNNLKFRTGETGAQGQIGVTWDDRIGGATMQLSAHGLRRHVDNPIPQRIVVIDRDAGGARIALSSASDRALYLAAGTEVQFQHDDRRNFVNLDGARGADTLDQAERVTNVALFAQATARIAPRLTLMAGGRVDRISFEARDRLIGTGNPDDSGERTMRAVSPSVGLTWSTSPRLDAYANYSTSFETPTTSELANQETGAGGFNPTLEPQRTRSVEAGLNGRVHAGSVAGTYQVAAYRAHVRDALIPFEVPSVPGRQYFRNAGSATHRGVESALALVFPRHVSLRASFTHTEARFATYRVTSGGSTAIYDGNPVPGVSPNRADAMLSFGPGRLFVDFETRVSSATPVNDAGSERSPGYVIHAVRLGARELRSGPVRISPHVGVQNLFDRDYNTSVLVNAFGGRYYEPGPPRSLNAGVDVRF